MFDDSQYVNHYKPASCFMLHSPTIPYYPTLSEMGFYVPLKGLILLSKDCIELLGSIPSINKINNSVWKVQTQSLWDRWQCTFNCKIKHKPMVNLQWAGASYTRKEGFISVSFILQKLYRSSGEEVKHKYTLTPDVPQFIQARYNAANVSDVSDFFTTFFTQC